MSEDLSNVKRSAKEEEEGKGRVRKQRNSEITGTVSPQPTGEKKRCGGVSMDLDPD